MLKLIKITGSMGTTRDPPKKKGAPKSHPWKHMPVAKRICRTTTSVLRKEEHRISMMFGTGTSDKVNYYH